MDNEAKAVVERGDVLMAQVQGYQRGQSEAGLSARSRIPEDSNHALFVTLYGALVSATKEQRTAAVRALVAIYNIDVF